MDSAGDCFDHALCAGDCFDHALCESFFATLECELIDCYTFRSQAPARMALFRFIEGWHNL